MTPLRELRGPDPSWWDGSDAVVLLDMGSSAIPELAHFDGSIVLDHHVFEGEDPRVVHVNPRKHGMDGSHDACASTLAYLVAVALSPRNVDLAPFAIGGIIGDRQHLDGLSEVNAGIVASGMAAGDVIRGRGLPLSGETIGEAIALSNDPFFLGLSGDGQAVDNLLGDLGIDPGASLHEVEAEPVASTALMGRLTLRLLAQGAAAENARSTFVDKFVFPRLGSDGQDLSNLVNSTGRLGNPGLGLAAVLGDRSAMKEARRMRKEYRVKVLAGLLDLRGRTVAMRRLQWFDNDVPNMGGALAGLGVSYILDPRRAAISLTSSGSELKVSARATRALVASGLDLAAALGTAAAGLGGTGGGHPVAAGATVPAEHRDEFLEALDAALVAQVGEISPRQAAPS